LEANIFLLQKTIDPYLFTGYKLAIKVISSQIAGAIACTSTCAELQRYDHDIVTLKTSILRYRLHYKCATASKIFTAGGPPGGQPPYRTAQLFAAETRPPHHHRTPEYNCEKISNSHKIVSGRHNNTTFDYKVPPTLKMLCILILSY
jgi:hypothetical protein